MGPQGGSPTTAGYRKSVYCETMALQYKIPLIRLHEGKLEQTNCSNWPAVLSCFLFAQFQ